MSSKCSIEMDRDPAVYTAGDCITGRVKMLPSSNKSEKLYDLQFVLTGVIQPWPMVKVTFAVYRRATRITIPLPMLYKTKRYATYAFCKNREDCILLPARGPEQSLAFEMQLPSNLFSSVMGHEGYALYKLIAVGRWGGPYPNGNEGGFLFNKEILIVARMPALRPGYELEYKDEKEWTNPKNPGQQSTLSVRLVEGRCSTGGGIVRFTVLVENGLQMPLGSIRCNLQQNVSWNFSTLDLVGTSSTKVRKDSKIIVTKDGPTIPPGPGRKVEWTSDIQVPHTIPSGKGANDTAAFNVGYRLTFNLTSKFVNLSSSIPFHIGTAESGTDDETLEWAYYNGFKRSLSATSLDALSLASAAEEGGSWLSLADVSSIASDEPGPTYPSETPPPPYKE